MIKEYITTDELAALLNLKRNTLERMRSRRECPIPWINVGRRVLYSRADVDEFLAGQKRDRVKCQDITTGG